MVWPKISFFCLLCLTLISTEYYSVYWTSTYYKFTRKQFQTDKILFIRFPTIPALLFLPFNCARLILNSLYHDSIFFLFNFFFFYNVKSAFCSQVSLELNIFSFGFFVTIKVALDVENLVVCSYSSVVCTYCPYIIIFV